MIEIINEDNSKYTWNTYRNFQLEYYANDFIDTPDDELTSAIKFLTNERRKAQRHDDTNEVSYIEKQLNILRYARDTKKKMQKGTHELEQQIENDIWSCIHNTDIDFNALKKVRAKYKDKASLYRSIEKRILDKERWYD